jgi:amidophosphoribosyltransferase
VQSVNPKVTNFEDSCFSGMYITGDVTQEYLAGVEARRREGAKMMEMASAASSQLDLGLELVE